MIVPALEEAGLLPSRVCGSSSGSIIAALYVRTPAHDLQHLTVHFSLSCSLIRGAPQAGGLEPCTTLEALLLSLRVEDILLPLWSAPGPGAYRINTAFLEQAAPAKRLEAGRLPVAVSTYDMWARRTVAHTAGPTAQVVAASCAIPLIMQPVTLAGRTHVDGGVGDLLALASCNPTERVLSIDLHTLGLMRGRQVHAALLGVRAPGAPLLGCTRLQLHGLPFVGPRTMGLRGAGAIAAGRAAMRAALATRGDWGGERVHVVKVPPGVVEAAVPGTVDVIQDAVPLVGGRGGARKSHDMEQD